MEWRTKATKTETILQGKRYSCVKFDTDVIFVVWQTWTVSIIRVHRNQIVHILFEATKSFYSSQKRWDFPSMFHFRTILRCSFSFRWRCTLLLLKLFMCQLFNTCIHTFKEGRTNRIERGEKIHPFCKQKNCYWFEIQATTINRIHLHSHSHSHSY